MSKFTPGPWLVGYDPDGDDSCQSIWYDKDETGAEIAGRICEPANARLIAAAPELYKLALRVSEGLDPLLSSHARTVLAEVEGS